MNIILSDILNDMKNIEMRIIDFMNTQKELNEKYITPTELSKVLNIHRGAVLQWIKKGIIKNYKQKSLNSKINIPYSEIDRITGEDSKLFKYRNNWLNFRDY